MKNVKHISPTKRIALSFFVVVFIGSLLLSLPISNVSEAGRYIDHLFVATSATCVTGLIPFTIADQYTLFGQIVIILLIQIGGLGFLTLLNMFYLLFYKRISLTNKIIMKEALNMNSMKDVGLYIKRVILYTLTIELLGALLLSVQFVGEFGLIKGLYYSIFHAISAFCNAGFDVLGPQSLIGYQTNFYINMIISGLIIAGGLGFVVWIDLIESFKKYYSKFKVFKFKKYIQTLCLHTKIVIVITMFLLVSGTLVIFALENNNVNTLANLKLSDQILVSYFQSVTLRTAGFASVDCALLNDSTKLFMSILMFIGGSPAGTAGGIKTVTVVIIGAYIYSLMKGHQHVKIMKKTIDENIVKSSLTIGMVSFFISIIALLVLTLSESANFIDLVFEVYSAIATVGITAGLTPLLTDIGKIVIIILMYIGRIGPMTLVLLFAKRNNQMKGKDVQYPIENVLIG